MRHLVREPLALGFVAVDHAIAEALHAVTSGEGFAATAFVVHGARGLLVR
jgi:hypothetical protein